MKTDPVYKQTVTKRGIKELMGLFIPFDVAEYYFSADWENPVCMCTYVITKNAHKETR